MSDQENEIILRPVTNADSDFLKAVFSSTRTDELAALGDPALIESFITMQFNAQQQSYHMAYPEAENSIILFKEQPVGRIMVDRGEQAMRLIDIALLPEFRARGIGSFLLRGLLDEAAAAGKSVLLSVYKFNPAVSLYERLGFLKVAEDGLYIQMQWTV